MVLVLFFSPFVGVSLFHDFFIVGVTDIFHEMKNNGVSVSVSVGVFHLVLFFRVFSLCEKTRKNKDKVQNKGKESFFDFFLFSLGVSVFYSVKNKDLVFVSVFYFIKNTNKNKDLVFVSVFYKIKNTNTNTKTKKKAFLKKVFVFFLSFFLKKKRPNTMKKSRRTFSKHEKNKFLFCKVNSFLYFFCLF